MSNQTPSHGSKLALILLGCGLLFACASPGLRSSGPASAPQTPLQQAAAAIASDDAAAAEAWLARFDPAQGQAGDELRVRTLRAEIALLRQQAEQALQMLPAPRQTGNAQLAAWIEEVRAQAYFAAGQPIAAVQALVERAQFLQSPDARQANEALIWNSLNQAQLDLGLQSRLSQADALTRGWVEQALIGRSVWLDYGAQQASVADWQFRNPNHPGNNWINRLDDSRNAAPISFRTIALLLPLQGATASAAQTVRDGFIGAWFADGVEQRPAVKIYDSGETLEAMLAAYQNALDDGAEFIVGPLRKDNVEALASQGQPPVPILALNYLDQFSLAPFNMYQWGLAPEDEARQAAERAVTDHQYRALVLAPNNAWGDRVSEAFSQRLQELGGQVLEQARFEAETRDYSTEIKRLLNLDESAQRNATIRAMLGEQPQFEPHRRQDVDLIFVAARSEQGRSIRPQLKFHRAGDLPLYSTALIYDGREQNDRELDGIRFCDMPWMLDTPGPWSSTQLQLAQQFPDRYRSLPRLFVLGHDAYFLVRLIQSGRLRPGMYLPAASGNLSLQRNGVISRGLHCATLENGKPQALPLDLWDTPMPEFGEPDDRQADRSDDPRTF